MFKKFLLFSWLLLINFGCTTNVLSPKQSEVDEKSRTSLLILYLTLNKEYYSSEEAIVATVRLTNKGNSSVIVKDRMLPGTMPEDKRNIDMLRDIRFYITSPSDEEILFGWRYEAPLLTSKDFISLAPGESIQNVFYLKEGYIFQNEYGIYQIYLVYYNYYDPSQFTSAWKGELTSKIVKFEIGP